MNYLGEEETETQRALSQFSAALQEPGALDGTCPPGKELIESIWKRVTEQSPRLSQALCHGSLANHDGP